MSKIKNLNLLVVINFILLSSCTNESCIFLDIEERYSFVSGIEHNKNIYITVGKLDNITGHLYLTTLLTFDKEMKLIRKKEDVSHILANYKNDIFMYSPFFHDELITYNTITGVMDTLENKVSFLSISKKAQNSNEVGSIMNDNDYSKIVSTEKNGYQIFQDTLFSEVLSTFSNTSHVYNDTLYINDKCYCKKYK